MTNLLRVVPDSLPALPPTLAAAAQAHQAAEPSVNQMLIGEVGKLFNRWLSRAALLLGHKSWQNDDELFTLAAACAEMVQYRFPAFKPSEIDLAMRRGGSGEYRKKDDEVVYVGLQTVTDWLSTYQTKARATVVQALHKLSTADVPRLPEAHPDRVKWRIDQLVELIETARERTLPMEADPGNCLYDWLKAIGMLNGFRTAAEYNDILVEETESVLNQPLPAHRQERGQLKSFAESLERQSWPAEHPLAKTVASACKKRVMREWLLEQAVSDEPIRPMLEEKAAMYYESHPEAA